MFKSRSIITIQRTYNATYMLNLRPHNLHDGTYSEHMVKLTFSTHFLTLLHKYSRQLFTCYLAVSVIPDELLVNACRSLPQLLWTIEAPELLAGEPEIQVFLTELWFQEVPEECLSTCCTAERHLIAEEADSTLACDAQEENEITFVWEERLQRLLVAAMPGSFPEVWGEFHSLVRMSHKINS